MFTGIVEELGKVKSISRQGRTILLAVEAVKVTEDAAIGDSICVNGACLTVVKKDKKSLSFEMMAETAELTDLGRLKLSEAVNLERSLKVGDRVCGHFVLGHVDCQGQIRSKGYLRDNLSFEIAVGAEFRKYLIAKGSVCVDGVSLTIGAIRPASFCVYVIPHTLKNTTLGFKGPGDRVNIEFDILAKSARPA